MNELSLFTGAGGGIWGSKLLGWRTVGYVEIDDYCQRVIRARIRDGYFDDAPIFPDVRTFDGRPYRGKVDIVTAGFPCHSPSVLLAKGKQDPTRETDGLTPFAFLAKSDRGSLYWKMCQGSFLSLMGILELSSVTFPPAGIMQNGKLFQQQSSGLNISGDDSGYLPTPTASNYGYNCSVNSRNRRGSLSQIFGGPVNPTWIEWFMGWPIGATELAPLATDKFQEWLLKHGGAW